MPGEDCVLEMEVDPQGILVVRISGEFNFDAWLAQRRQLFRGDLAELDLDGRANLVDLSSLVPPQEDWFATVNRVVQELRTMGQPTGPVAYVVGAAEANTLTVKFFESVSELGGFKPGNFRTFTGYREAYDWLQMQMQNATGA